MKSALVVCHPDDESLWFGGLVLTEPGDWTIICCSVPRADPIRAWQFFDACDVLGAKGRIMPIIEPPPGTPIDAGLLDRIALDGFDRIVTHGREGEYGHKHHIGLHEYILDKWGQKEILSFCPQDKVDYDLAIELNEVTMARKFDALTRYNNVTPYDGRPMPKFAALIKRYCEDRGWNLATERYRIHRPR